MMDGEEDDLGQDDDDEDQVEQSHHKIILCLATLTTWRNLETNYH